MKNPFVVGGWVRGERFFGRQGLLQEVLEGDRQFLWLLGMRRVGKTSFLKQLEHLALADGNAGRWIPLFWDLEGSQNPEGLRDGLLESVEAADDRIAAVGVRIAELEGLDLFGILRALKRRAREAGSRLLLLCDECEELINIERSSPEMLPRLRRVFQEGESVRTVLAATKRLFALERSGTPDTSPFLHGFVPPVYLGRLDDAEAAALFRQGGFRDEVVTQALARTDNHPYLLQLLGKRLFEGGELDQVLEDIASDDIVSHFFAIDYEYLSPMEKQIVLHMAQTRTVSSHDLGARLGLTASQASTLVHGLHRLGYIRQEAGLCCISNWFFARWLQQHHGIEPEAAAGEGGAGGLPDFDGESSLELLRRAHAGDQRALVQLCARYHSAFRRWAEGRVPHGVRSKVDTEDLLRETLFGVLAQVEAEHEGELWDHLRQELLRRIDGEIGRLGRGGVRPAAEDAPALSSVCPEEEIVGREKLQRYEAALARLEPHERQAVVMRVEMGCSYEHVADSIGKPSPGAARMTVCRALVRLAREMSRA